MNNQQYVCGRDENPETCFLCEQEGNDYCTYCADGFTLEEYKQIEDFFFITATSKKETSESIIFTKESGGVWEFYKKYIVAIKTV